MEMITKVGKGVVRKMKMQADEIHNGFDCCVGAEAEAMRQEGEGAVDSGEVFEGTNLGEVVQLGIEDVVVRRKLGLQVEWTFKLTGVAKGVGDVIEFMWEWTDWKVG